MRNGFMPTRLLRTSMLPSFLLIAAPMLFAQSAAIEPCQATPDPKSVISKSSLAPTLTGTKPSQTQINSSIADDPAVEKMLTPYSDKVRALSIVIGTLEGEMKKGTVGAGTLGNFVTDAMLAAARKRIGKSVTLAIVNAGGLRKNEIAAGQLHVSDIFELLPFENALITVDLSGAQILKLARSGTRDAQAGARIRYRWNEQNRTEVIAAKLADSNGRDLEIDSNGTYTIVTVNYLYELKSGTYSLLQEGKNLKPLDITARDAVIEYVKSETSAGRPIRARLDDRFVQIGPGPAKREDPPND